MPSDPTLLLTGEQVRELGKQFGTPLYVVDETIFRKRIRSYRKALEKTWPNSRLAYASKANSHVALLRIAFQEDCLIDAASEGEIEAALRAGVPPSSINLHGNNKSAMELDRAIELGIREIIVDNSAEITAVANRHDLLRKVDTKLLLRLAPGVDPKTHKRIATGQDDTKFGFNIADGSAEEAVGLCVESGLPLVGFHAHVGSQLLDPEAQIVAAERVAQFAVDMNQRFEVNCKELNLGGGLGVSHSPSQHPAEIADYVQHVNLSANSILKKAGLNPMITHEPGRALIGPAGVTIYQIGSAKPVHMLGGSTKVYVSVDGGLADNPRPALYDAIYEVQATSNDPARVLDCGKMVAVTICGRHCETDNLFENIMIPSNARPGDFLQVLATGAYNNSMASNYNRYPRPKMVLIRKGGEAQLIQREETWDEMFERETIPEGL